MGSATKHTQAAITAGFAEAQRLEKIFSRHDPMSELSTLNRTPTGVAIGVSDELNAVLSFAARLEQISNGRFCLQWRRKDSQSHSYDRPEDQPDAQPNHRLGYQLDETLKIFTRWTCACVDLDGIAKGYIVDQVFVLLTKAMTGNDKHAPYKISVNAGGDLRVSHQDNIALRIPRLPDRKAKWRRNTEMDFVGYELAGVEGALATSSCVATEVNDASFGARYHPHPTATLSDDTPHKIVASVVTTAAECMPADALTKLAMGLTLSNAITTEPRRMAHFFEQFNLMFNLNRFIGFDFQGQVILAWSRPARENVR